MGNSWNQLIKLVNYKPWKSCLKVCMEGRQGEGRYENIKLYFYMYYCITYEINECPNALQVDV